MKAFGRDTTVHSFWANSPESLLFHYHPESIIFGADSPAVFLGGGCHCSAILGRALYPHVS